MYNYGAVNLTSAQKIRDKILARGGSYIDPMPIHTDAQRGPTCGLYALSFVMRYWYDRAARNSQPLGGLPLKARKADLGAPKDPTYVKDPSRPQSLREIARTATTTAGNPISYIGEIFSGEAMAAVARKAGFQATVHKVTNDNYLATIYDLIDRGIPPIVGVDVDADATTPDHSVSLKNTNYACPGKFNGDNAHWITLVGYCTYNGNELLFQMNWGKYYHFLARSLKESTNQLLRFVKPESRAWQKHAASTAKRGQRWTTNVGTATRTALLAPWAEPRDASFLRGNSTEYAGRTRSPSGNTLTTVFPEVILDLSNQVVEVTPPPEWDATPPPEWQDDSAVTACPICLKKFGTLTRRHHCRVCGRVVCDNCSKGRKRLMPVRRTNGAPETGAVRICNRCAAQLG
jgi:hypothetical protein